MKEKNNKNRISQINDKIDEYSKKAEPHMNFWIFVTILASVVTPSLLYVYTTYKDILKNGYVYLGILMLLIPILLEILLSLGIKQKLFVGMVFTILYLVLIAILVIGIRNSLLLAFTIVFIGYLISYIVTRGFIIFIKELEALFTATKNAIVLLGQVMIPIFGTAIPIVIAVTIKYLLSK